MKFCEKLYDINAVKELFFKNGKYLLIFFERVNWSRGPPLIFASDYFFALGGPVYEPVLVRRGHGTTFLQLAHVYVCVCVCVCMCVVV